VTAVAAVVAVVALLATYLTWTAERIDRLNVRVEKADATLDAQLVRRAAAAQALVTSAAAAGDLPDGAVAAVRSLATSARQHDGDRWATENALTRAVADAVQGLRARAAESDASSAAAAGESRLPAELAELADASERVDLARSFYNQAVRDTRELRARLVPRLLRLHGRAGLPAFIELDDTTLQ
jgi:hypothetical protein